MRRVIAFSVVVLAGCAATPAEVRETGERTMHSSALSPRQAGLCMVRNMENQHAYATSREGITPGTEEVVIGNTPQGVLWTQAIADIRPATGGSQIDLIVAPVVINKDTLRGLILKGC